jgi:hypothetical protein
MLMFMNSRLALSVLGIPLLVTPVSANYSRVAWQAFVDNRWTADRVSIDPQVDTVRIRGVIDWDYQQVYALCSCYMDIVVQSANEDDRVSDYLKLAPFDPVSQSLVASRQGSTLKIDEVGDESLPGLGMGSVRLTQYAEFLGLPFSTGNPVAAFEFSLHLSGDAGVRVIDSVNTHLPTGQIVPCRGYINRDGVSIPMPEATTSPLEILVVPAVSMPLSSAVCGLTMLLRRTRPGGPERP